MTGSRRRLERWRRQIVRCAAKRRTTRPRSPPARPRVTERVTPQYDLLTAALIGVAHRRRRRRSCCGAVRRDSGRMAPVLPRRQVGGRAEARVGAGAAGAARGRGRAARSCCDRIPHGRDRGERPRVRSSEARDRIDGFVALGAHRPAEGAPAPAQAPRRLSATRRASLARLGAAWPPPRWSLLVAAAGAPRTRGRPGTHVFLGEAVLRSLAPAARRGRRPAARLPVRLPVRVDRRRHEHREEVRARRAALPLVDGRAGDPRRRARRAAARLRARLPRAPRRRRRSPTTTSSRSSSPSRRAPSALGHSYWESRFETHLGPSARAAGARADPARPLARPTGCSTAILSPTIFSTPTNRRIFRGMVHVADSESWQRIFELMTENSRWDLRRRRRRAVPGALVRLRRSTSSCASTARSRTGSTRRATSALRLAKRVRREALRAGAATRAR